MTKKHSFEDLQELYRQADTVDSEIFAEMRSNILLVSGDHYTKKSNAFNRRLRDSKDVSEQQKLRLTKNHTQKIVKTYVNNITSLAPGVSVAPKNESELQDQKSAELHEAVWQDAKIRLNYDELVDTWGEDFVEVGEVHTKIFFDPSAGPIKAYQQKVDGNGQNLFLDGQGEETLQQTQAPAPGEPIYGGDILCEEIHGFNLLRDPDAKDLKKSPYLIVRKMVQRDDLLAKFPDKEKLLNATADKTYVIFDASKGGYRNSKNEVLLKEYYFRACPLYPKGYFYFSTEDGVLVEGELPGGIFPIVSQSFDRVQTTPRGRSPVKVMRPYQAEINRTASKIAEHQITLGDDKLLILNGTKVSPGVALPGVRSINYSGTAPTILSGRDGSQYLAYMQAQIEEMYDVLNVQEMAEETNAQLDPYALLFRSAGQKKKFSRYVKRFERFLVEVCKTYLALAKIHMSEDQIIYAVGRRERINIAEFKNSDDISHQIKVEPQAEDIESKLGRQMVLNHVLQYTASKMEKEDIGKLMRAMPYANFEQSFDDLTIDYDAATNDILALDRGEFPGAHQYDNHVYVVKRLTSRMRQADFKFLGPQVQMNYQKLLQMHEQLEAQAQQQIQAAAAGFIPSGGYLVSCDFYMPQPGNPNGKTQRVRLPSEAISWLIDKLETQGSSLQELQGANQGAVAQIGGMVAQHNPGAQFPNGMGGSLRHLPTAGQEGPAGVPPNGLDPINSGILPSG